LKSQYWAAADGPSAAAGDELVARALGERQIGEPVAMEVAEFYPPEAELDTAETVGGLSDSVPSSYFVFNGP
jgi:hypothetical protein